MDAQNHQNTNIKFRSVKVADTTALLEALKIFVEFGVPHDRIKDYITTNIVSVKMVYVKGLTTIIKDYTNKKGNTFKAHYTINGKYLGSVKNKGETPYKYDGYTKYIPHKYTICVNSETIELFKTTNKLGSFVKPITPTQEPKKRKTIINKKRPTKLIMKD